MEELSETRKLIEEVCNKHIAEFEHERNASEDAEWRLTLRDRIDTIEYIRDKILRRLELPRSR